MLNYTNYRNHINKELKIIPTVADLGIVGPGIEIICGALF